MRSEPAAMSVAAAQFLDAFRRLLPSIVGVANLVTFPDGLSGGAHIALQRTVAGPGGPLLLTEQQTLSPVVEAYMSGGADMLSQAFVYGGDAAVGPGVRDAILEAITG